MVDKLNGRRMGIKSTGSGRRESYKYAPTSRMTNTFILGGKSTLDEMYIFYRKRCLCKVYGEDL